MLSSVIMINLHAIIRQIINDSQVHKEDKKTHT